MKKSHFKRHIAYFFLVLMMVAFSPGLLLSKDSELQFKPVLVGEEVTFGEQQLRHMLKDRPTMSEYISHKDPIWDQIVLFFSGSLSKHPIYWDSKVPTKPIQYVSEGMYYFPGRSSSFIRLRDVDSSGDPIHGEQLWAMLIFEFQNICNGKDYIEIHNKVFSGKLTRRQFIEMHTRLEYKALSKEIEFYKNVWIPHTNRIRKTSNPEFWIRNYKPTYEEWISQYKDENKYPFDSIGKFYDKEVIPRIQVK